VQQRGQGLRWWLFGSAALMVIGAFGPWAKVLGASVGGTDGSNDGWLVVGAAVIGGLLAYTLRERRAGAVWALLAGIAGVAVTLYDRSNMQNAIDKGGSFTQALVQIGWGLNLALVASISLAVAAVVTMVRSGEALDPDAARLLPPPTPPVGEPPPTSSGAPTPPPD